MKRIYLDVCSLCRPFDDQDYIRIRLETDSVNLILSKAKQNLYQLMKSKVHYIEINSITDDLERIELLELLNSFGTAIKVDPEAVKERIADLVSHGFGVADAAHISFSEMYNATFITCDDKLLKKCATFIHSVQCANPITFCEMENLK